MCRVCLLTHCRMKNCLNLHNSTVVLASQQEMDYLNYMYSMFNSPLPNMRQATTFYHTELGCVIIQVCYRTTQPCQLAAAGIGHPASHIAMQPGRFACLRTSQLVSVPRCAYSELQFWAWVSQLWHSVSVITHVPHTPIVLT